MPEVNFLIMGAQKSGTSALHRYLSQHPEICMAPVKEVHLFDAPDYDDGASTSAVNARYLESFPNYQGEPLLGEATPIYLYWPAIAGRIQRYNPSMKLIVLLRDPADRAVSHYHMERNRNQEALPMSLAFAVEPWRLWRDRNNIGPHSSLRKHSYLARGRYRGQLDKLYRQFPREQVLVLRSESLWRDHVGTLQRVYAFLDVHHRSFVPQQEVTRPGDYDATHTAPWLRTLLRWYFRRELQALPPVAAVEAETSAAAGRRTVPGSPP